MDLLLLPVGRNGKLESFTDHFRAFFAVGHKRRREARQKKENGLQFHFPAQRRTEPQPPDIEQRRSQRAANLATRPQTEPRAAVGSSDGLNFMVPVAALV